MIYRQTICSIQVIQFVHGLRQCDKGFDDKDLIQRSILNKHLCIIHLIDAWVSRLVLDQEILIILWQFAQQLFEVSNYRSTIVSSFN